MTPRERAKRAVGGLIVNPVSEADEGVAAALKTVIESSNMLERLFPEIVQIYDNIEREIKEAVEEATCVRH